MASTLPSKSTKIDGKQLNTEIYRVAFEIPTEGDFQPLQRATMLDADAFSEDDALEFLADLLVAAYLKEKDYVKNN